MFGKGVFRGGRFCHGSGKRGSGTRGGCFWCLEAVFKRIPGVVKILPGYAGGVIADPTYQQVCSGETGHAEVIHLTFDPGILSYRELLGIFFRAHDPTTVNRQGADVGPQYRSIILPQGEEQHRIARETVEALDCSGRFSRSVVTEITPLKSFYPAEEYHHDYYDRNPAQGYCGAVIRPKLRKLHLEWRPLE